MATQTLFRLLIAWSQRNRRASLRRSIIADSISCTIVQSRFKSIATSLHSTLSPIVLVVAFVVCDANLRAEDKLDPSASDTSVVEANKPYDKLSVSRLPERLVFDLGILKVDRTNDIKLELV